MDFGDQGHSTKSAEPTGSGAAGPALIGRWGGAGAAALLSWTMLPWLWWPDS
jgi:hypothetical protein